MATLASWRFKIIFNFLGKRGRPWGVSFQCRFCRYEEPQIAVGHGRSEVPFLALFRCHHCHSLGSTWIHANKIPRCSQCYDDAVTILPDDTRRVNCPRCGAPGVIAPKEGSWE